MVPPDFSDRSCLDDWEYEYAQPDNQPRKYEKPSLGPSAPDNYSQEEDYTTRPADPPNVESLTQDFAGASISPGGGTYTSGTYPSASSSERTPAPQTLTFSPLLRAVGRIPELRVLGTQPVQPMVNQAMRHRQQAGRNSLIFKQKIHILRKRHLIHVSISPLFPSCLTRHRL